MTILAQDQLSYVGVKALFVNTRGQYLVLKRNVDYATTPRRSWYDIPGGKNQANETMRETLIRELHEEIGLEPTDYTIGRQLGCIKTDITLTHGGLSTALFLVVYLCTLQSENHPITIVAPENKSSEWMDTEQMADAFEKYSSDFMTQLASLR